jgi:Helix-turn-helix domain
MILDAAAPHTRVDNFVIDDYLDKIDVRGLGIYMVIKRHYNWITGQCTPSYKRLAQLCNLSRRTVIRYVKRLKEAGLIDPQMRFTDERQTSNQYEFYQPERPKKPAPAPAQPSTPEQTDTTEQLSMPPSDTGVTPPVTVMSPDQVVLNKEEKEENTKTMPAKTEKAEKPASKEKTTKQKECPHPYAEVVTLFDGTTICNHCYDLLIFQPDKEAV